MADKIHDLVEFDTVTLGDIRFPETEFCVETLIPAGICVLGGAPKVGKSWLALDLCMKVAKGERFWNQRTRQIRPLAPSLTMRVSAPRTFWRESSGRAESRSPSFSIRTPERSDRIS